MRQTIFFTCFCLIFAILPSMNEAKPEGPEHRILITKCGGEYIEDSNGECVKKLKPEIDKENLDLDTIFKSETKPDPEKNAFKHIFEAISYVITAVILLIKRIKALF